MLFYICKYDIIIYINISKIRVGYLCGRDKIIQCFQNIMRERS